MPGELLEIEAKLMAEAERTSGLSDWGADRSFQNGLRVYIEDLMALAPPQAEGLRARRVSRRTSASRW
jgi:hypothetical protein